jgi:hypothetical protein
MDVETIAFAIFPHTVRSPARRTHLNSNQTKTRLALQEYCTLYTIHLLI